jgi:hypothetical protein
MECDVEAALDLVLEDGSLRSMEQIKVLVEKASKQTMPKFEPPKVDLISYDQLLVHQKEAAS